MNSTEDLISEYRVYVVDGEIRAICHYKGPQDARSWKEKDGGCFFSGDVFFFLRETVCFARFLLPALKAVTH